MRFRGELIAHYKGAHRHFCKVHYERDAGYFTVYTYAPESGWLHSYQCKDFLKAAAAVSIWKNDHASN